MTTSTILPAHKYTEWTDNWRAVVESHEPLSFFLQDDKPQTGVVFHFDSLRYLFSVPGLVNIRIRFGLHKSEDGLRQEFHPILFGINSREEIITPYFISSAFAHDPLPEEVENEGNLPQELMRVWQKNWHEHVLAEAINEQMFWINDGVLRGYNYARQDVMDAVGSFPGTSEVHLKFGLHQYYSMQDPEAEEPAFAYTFGLMLYASVRTPADASTSRTSAAPVARPTAGVGREEDSGFYDFTAPCPYTC